MIYWFLCSVTIIGDIRESMDPAIFKNKTEKKTYERGKKKKEIVSCDLRKYDESSSST